MRWRSGTAPIATGSPPQTSTTRSTTQSPPGPIETNVNQIYGVLYIGPDHMGRMLEIITVEDIDDGDVAIHAVRLRKTYEGYLPREERP